MTAPRPILDRVPPSWGGPLNDNDYATLAASWITREIAEQAMLRRVDKHEGREVVGQKGNRDCAGILFPYYWPGQPSPINYRLRRDNPDWIEGTNGKPKQDRKYLGPPKSSNRLYILPGVTPEQLADVNIPIAITEGEKKALALLRLALHETTFPRFVPIAIAGVWSWRGTVGKAIGPNGERCDVKGVIPDFDLLAWAGRQVLIAFDSDVRGNEDVQAARNALAVELRRRGARVAFLGWDPAMGKGIDDHIVTVGPEKVLQEIAAIDFEKLGTKMPIREGQQETIAQTLEQTGLSQLKEEAPIEEIEEALRKLAASAIGADSIRRAALRSAAMARLTDVGVSSPAKFVDAALKESRNTDEIGEGRELLFTALQAWPDPVDGDQLLCALAAFFERFTVVQKGGTCALSLWVLHTYALAAAYISPILAIVSPEKRCGKTVLLDVLFRLVWRAITVANITAASLFRAVEKWTPTLLVDEADSFLAGNEELRGVISSGHRRDTAKVIRTVGDEHEPRIFSTWGPKAIALIGRLPATLEDRSIVLPMKRKTSNERVERFRPERIVDELEVVRRKALRWVADNLETLRESDPTIPDVLNDRAQDNWRPLLAIADAAGGSWPERARGAAILLSSQDNAGENSGAMQLLSDLRDFFQNTMEDFLPSDEVVAKLLEMEERPWGEWTKGKPITKIQVAAILKKFGIRPKQIWVDSSTSRGYRLADFNDAFSRYLPCESVESVGTNDDKGLSEVFDSVGNDIHTDSEKAPKGPPIKASTDSTDSKPQYGAKDGQREAWQEGLAPFGEGEILPPEEPDYGEI
jgi:putative DNA primase/helicase